MTVKNKLKGYKTILLNGALAILPVLQVVDVAPLMNPKQAAAYGLVVAVSNAILRCYTTTSVFKKD